MSDKLKIGLQFFADQSPGAHIYIYSNDGAELLGTVNSDTWKGVLLTVGLFYNEYYKCISNVIGGYPYGSDFDLTSYAGIANTPNATEPTYADGYNFGNSGIYTVYVVESGGGGSTLDVTYNSTKIIDSFEVTPPVTVTYNGSTIASLNAGDTKTLQCNGKVMASDLVIGDKTLQCNGKLMASDVVIEVGGVTPTGETWVMKETGLSLQPNTSIQPAKFTSNGKQYKGIGVSSLWGQARENAFLYYIIMENNNYENVGEIRVYEGSMNWYDEAYRTITLDEPATGDFLTWLEANAVKQ